MRPFAELKLSQKPQRRAGRVAVGSFIEPAAFQNLKFKRVTNRVGSVSGRPKLSAVDNVDNLQCGSVYTVDQNERQSRKWQFSCARDASNPPSVREVLQGVRAFVDRLRYPPRNFPIILLNVFDNIG